MAQALKVEQGAPPVDTSGRYRWIVCALLFFATTINYMDRQILSLLKPILDNQMGWTNEQFGAINSAFQGAYAVGGLAFGWLVDRIGSKIGYSISITGWSLAALGHAHARGVIHGDLKPSNVMLDLASNGRGPRAYVLDLGLAWLREYRHDSRLDGTRAPEVAVHSGAGTVGWVAQWKEMIEDPEQKIGRPRQLYIGATERPYVAIERRT